MSVSFQFAINPQLSAQTINATKPLLIRAAVFAEGIAKSRVPVETGNLLRSGRSGLTSEAGLPVGFVAFTAPYAVFVELGTRRMAAQPYLRPALMALRGFLKG